MDAKLIRVILEKDNDPIYYREYEYECIRCGAHFFRHTCNDRINPYCAKCCRENERIKARVRAEQKKHEIILDELCQIRKKISELQAPTEWAEREKGAVLYIIDKHIYQNGGTHAKRD